MAIYYKLFAQKCYMMKVTDYIVAEKKPETPKCTTPLIKNQYL